MGKKLTALTSAIWVLQDEYPRELGTSEIAYLAERRGYWSHRSKTPAQTMEGRMSTYLRKGGQEIERIKAGLFRYVPQSGLFPISPVEAREYSDTEKGFEHRLKPAHALLRVQKYLQDVKKQTGDQTAPIRQERTVLLNSTVVFIVGAWQYSVKQLIRKSAMSILGQVKQYKELPDSLIEKVADFVQKQSLSGGISHKGRKNIKKYVESELMKYNSPNAKRTVRLFKDCLGIMDISSMWKVGHIKEANMCKRLDDHVNARHLIVHESKIFDFGGREVEKILKFFRALVKETDACVSAHVDRIVAKAKSKGTGGRD